MIDKITSKDNARVKYANSLKTPQGRKEHHQFLAEGLKALEMALEMKIVKEVFTTIKVPHIPDSVRLNIVHKDVLEKIAFSKNPEGVVFICDFVKLAPKKMDKVLYLDHINDPGNMGTILRTALAFNFDAVIISDGSVDIYNEKVVAASKGSMYKLPILFGPLDKYVSNQKIIVSSLNDKSIDLNKLVKPESFILVLGNESHGVSDEITNSADIVVKIPMHGIDSLNVSVAAGILMYYLS